MKTKKVHPRDELSNVMRFLTRMIRNGNALINPLEDGCIAAIETGTGVSVIIEGCSRVYDDWGRTHKDMDCARGQRGKKWKEGVGGGGWT